VTRGRLLAAAVAVAAGGLVWALVARREVPAEELIRRKAVAMADAAERKDVGLVMKQLSERFRTEDGMSRDEVRGYLAAEILRGEWVRVFTANLEVTVTSASTADFRGVYIFGRSQAKLLKDLARESVIGSYEITARVEKEGDGEWRFVSASWREADPSAFF
jgi:hypothetical protein